MNKLFMSVLLSVGFISIANSEKITISKRNIPYNCILKKSLNLSKYTDYKEQFIEELIMPYFLEFIRNNYDIEIVKSISVSEGSESCNNKLHTHINSVTVSY